MGDHNVTQAERPPLIEEHQHGDPHADFRDDDGQEQQSVGGKAKRKTKAPQQHRSGHPEDHADDHVDHGDGQRIDERGNQRIVFHRFEIIFCGEAVPHDVAFRIIETERHQCHDGRIQHHKKQPPKPPHPPAASIVQRLRPRYRRSCRNARILGQ